MKKVAAFLVFLLVLLVMAVIAGLLLPSHISVVRSVDIHAPVHEVRNHLRSLPEWKNWYPAFDQADSLFFKSDPSSHAVSFRRANGQPVSITLKDSAADQLTYLVKPASSAGVEYVFSMHPQGDTLTRLTWSIYMHMGPYPWKKIRGIFLNKFSGMQSETALQQLKRSVEAIRQR